MQYRYCAYVPVKVNLYLVNIICSKKNSVAYIYIDCKYTMFDSLACRKRTCYTLALSSTILLMIVVSKINT